MAVAMAAAGLDRVPTVRRVQAAAALSAIFEPEVDLALWQRRPPAELAPLIDAKGPGDLPHLRLDAVAPVEVSTRLSEVLDGDAEDLAPLVADVAKLAGLYGRLFDRRRIRLRLETITTDSCSLFHVDRVRVRLLTTYVGLGTDWLDRGAAASEPIHRFERFAVGLLKGSLWPGSAGCAHRSPPIAAPASIACSFASMTGTHRERQNRAGNLRRLASLHRGHLRHSLGPRPLSRSGSPHWPMTAIRTRAASSPGGARRIVAACSAGSSRRRQAPPTLDARSARPALIGPPHRT